MTPTSNFSHFLRSGLLALYLCLPASAPAQDASDITWLVDLTSDKCSDGARRTVASAARNSIESSVARAEASIRPPSPVAGLSCIGPLLKAPLDTFSATIGGLAGILGGSVSAGFDFGLDQAICRFAEKKIGQMTTGLTGPLQSILSTKTREIAAITRFNQDHDFNVGTLGPVASTAPPTRPSPTTSTQPPPRNTAPLTEAEINDLINAIRNNVGNPGQ